jgi:hypothetical protein
MLGDTLTVLNFTNDSLIWLILFDVNIRAEVIQCLRVWFKFFKLLFCYKLCIIYYCKLVSVDLICTCAWNHCKITFVRNVSAC